VVETDVQWRIYGRGLVQEPPFERTAVIFVTSLVLFQRRLETKLLPPVTRCIFWPENALKCVCGRGSAPDTVGRAYSAPSAANLFTVDSCRVVPAR